jgi:hypothetical protein
MRINTGGMEKELGSNLTAIVDITNIFSFFFNYQL